MSSKLSTLEISKAYLAIKKAIYKVSARYGRTLPQDVRDDLSQVAVMKVYEAFNPEAGNVGQLAFVAGVNVATDYLRGKGYAGGTKIVGVEGTSDDDGNVTEYEVPCMAPSPLAALIMMERQAEIACRIADSLPQAEREAILVSLDDERPMTGGERIGKIRGLDKLKDVVLA